jgi:hypothetical protein
LIPGRIDFGPVRVNSTVVPRIIGLVAQWLVGTAVRIPAEFLRERDQLAATIPI